jgi:hypothetical protein
MTNDELMYGLHNKKHTDLKYVKVIEKIQCRFNVSMFEKLKKNVKQHGNRHSQCSESLGRQRAPQTCGNRLRHGYVKCENVLYREDEFFLECLASLVFVKNSGRKLRSPIGVTIFV